MKKLFNILDNILVWLNMLFLFLIITLTLIQVADRYYFKIGLRGLQEITILLFIWGIFLGSALAVKNGEHFKIDIWPARFNKLNKILNIFSGLIMLVVALVLLRQGYDLAVSSLNRFSRQLGIRRSWSTAVIPVSGMVMIFYLLKDLFYQIITTKKP